MNRRRVTRATLAFVKASFTPRSSSTRSTTLSWLVSIEITAALDRGRSRSRDLASPRPGPGTLRGRGVPAAAKAGPAGLPNLPGGWIAARLSHVDLNHGPAAKFFTHLAEANTPRANAVLAKIHHITDELGLDDSLLESLIAGRVASAPVAP